MCLSPYTAQHGRSRFKTLFFTFERANFNPFKHEFTIVIFIHYKLRIAVAIPDL